jgi:hypothetical protein
MRDSPLILLPKCEVIHCGFFPLEIKTAHCLHQRDEHKRFSGAPMKKLVFALLATLVAVSVAGCAGGMGKGKARPAVVTKG